MTRTLIALLALCLAITAPVAVAQTVCDADIQRDGYIDGADLTVILGSWGPCAACAGDISGDHLVDGIDLAIVLARWGGSCVPTISAVNPNNGPASGGTPITITGSGLQGTSSVLIGGIPATSVVVVNSTTVTAVTPPGTAGARTVSLTTPAGGVSVRNGFTFVAVSIPPWATMLEAMPDPAVVTSAALRTAIEATGYAWRVRHNSSGIEMLLVPPTTFAMGCSAFDGLCVVQEIPSHAITLSSPYYIGRYEVTQAQWSAVMGGNPASFQGVNYPNPESRPVETVSWNVVHDFLAATGLRLPTEAEWERAYRADTSTALHAFPGHPLGSSDIALAGEIAWHGGNNGAIGSPNWGPKPIGQKPANTLGFHDMGGNVYEYINDWYAVNYYASSPVVNPSGPTAGTYRVVRGGAWNSSAGETRASSRGASSPDEFSGVVGFRVARNP